MLPKYYFVIILIIVAVVLSACKSASVTSSESEKSSTVEISSISSISEPSVSSQSSNSEPRPFTNSQSLSSHSQQSSDTDKKEVVDESLNDEMTIKVIDKNGNPVENITVCVPGKAINGMITYSVTAKDGIAVLQRVRTTYEIHEKVNISLFDYNQGKKLSQYYLKDIPEDNITPVELVWKGKLPSKAAEESLNKVIVEVVDQDGQPVEGLWVNVDYYTADGGTNFDKPDLLERYVWTNSKGQAVFVNLKDDVYVANANDGRPFFENVSSDHPRLQLPFPNSMYSEQFEYNGLGEKAIRIVWEY